MERLGAGFGLSRTTAYRYRDEMLMNPTGEPLWVSDVLPGPTHDATAAREPVLGVAWHYTAEIPILADCGYEGAGCGVLTLVPHRTDGIIPS